MALPYATKQELERAAKEIKESIPTPVTPVSGGTKLYKHTIVISVSTIPTSFWIISKKSEAYTRLTLGQDGFDKDIITINISGNKIGHKVTGSDSISTFKLTTGEYSSVSIPNTFTDIVTEL